MKIAHICPFYTPAIGGVKQVVEELAERQVKQGHEIHVYTSDSDKEKRIAKKEETIRGVKIHRCPYWFKVSRFAYVWPSLFQKLWKEHSKGKFDVIHTHVFGHAHTFLASLAAKLRKIPHMHTSHCPWTEEFRPFLARAFVALTYPTLGKTSLKWTDKIIAITPWEYSFLERWGASREKIVSIPNGMDKVFYKQIRPNKFKQKFKGKIVLFLGRLNITKGPEKLIKAAREILKERKDINFVFIGPDEGMMSKIKKMSKGQNKIHILGPIRGKAKLAEAYQAADVYVLPSFREGLPLTLFEAMACGLPIVASPVNGIPYEMSDPQNGFFVKYGDIAGLKEKILKLLDDGKLARKISKNNKRKAEAYKWDKILRQTERVYSEA